MHFLPDVYVPCETCQGRRYNRETLEVRFKGKSIADVLEMSVEEALEFFAKIPKLRRRLQTLHDVGLDYIKLGQPATTLSGGEAQRVKLAVGAVEDRDRADALHPRRADDRPALRRHREAARGAAAARRRRQHGARDRAQPRRDQAGRLDHRPRARGRRGGRRGDRDRHAGGGGRGRGLGHGPVPARGAAEEGGAEEGVGQAGREGRATRTAGSGGPRTRGPRHPRTERRRRLLERDGQVPGSAASTWSWSSGPPSATVRCGITTS